MTEQVQRLFDEINDELASVKNDCCLDWEESPVDPGFYRIYRLNVDADFNRCGGGLCLGSGSADDVMALANAYRDDVKRTRGGKTESWS